MANTQRMEDKSELLKGIPLPASVPNDSDPTLESAHTFVSALPYLKHAQSLILNARHHIVALNRIYRQQSDLSQEIVV